MRLESLGRRRLWLVGGEGRRGYGESCGNEKRRGAWFEGERGRKSHRGGLSGSVSRRVRREGDVRTSVLRAPMHASMCTYRPVEVDASPCPLAPVPRLVSYSALSSCGGTHSHLRIVSSIYVGAFLSRVARFGELYPEVDQVF